MPVRRNTFPWAYTQLHQTSAALRECVARVEFLPFCELASIAAAKNSELFNTVARWRVYQPGRYAELIECISAHRTMRKKGKR
jgi:hypothetical protein